MTESFMTEAVGMRNKAGKVEGLDTECDGQTTSSRGDEPTLLEGILLAVSTNARSTAIALSQATPSLRAQTHD